MRSRVCIFCNSFTSLGQSHRTKSGISFFRGKSIGLCKLLISAQLSAIEQRRIVSVLIAEHGVHTFRRNLVIAHLNILVLVLLINRVETTKIIHKDFTIWLLLSCILVVIPGHLSLTGLHHRVRLVTI